MTMFVVSDDSSRLWRRPDLIAEIERRGAAYARALRGSLDAGSLQAEEAAHIIRMDMFTSEILERFADVLPRRQGYSLALHDLYRPALTISRDDAIDLTALSCALLAACTELLGHIRLSRGQLRALAELFEYLARRFRRHSLPSHAARCLEHAASIYLGLQDHSARDRCLIEQASAQRIARPFGVSKIASWISFLLAGYGYQPYRLLAWIAMELALFSILVTLVSGQPLTDGVYVCMVNFLNPLGLGDVANLPAAAKIVLVVESYSGLISTSIFFALVVRRWFRL